ncbi:zinc finger protein 469 [Hyperolius riggenbachi]|uniref:zinc finger protein 469 n=1 Tax=Hyperolius riggenbachi TaxID=752182 RepID=UPI0035A39000
MTGETKHVYAINIKTPSSKENDTALEHFSKKDAADSKPSRVLDNSESALTADKTSHVNGRERENHSQREAVIRPQQAGKIDFKSLQNRSKFSSDATWTNGKSSPLSPTGKSRGKDKNKRSGKGDRTQHQLYRLSINSSRSNPTIGIAYPQQKVTPPKKVEVSHGTVSGSYRFHVPSLPEREAELHQEDLNYNHSLPEPSPSLTSSNYTSQTAAAARTHQGLKLQSGNLHNKANSNGQLDYLEFQPNGNTWPPPDKHFSGTNGYSIPPQKLCPFPENNKPDSHSFGPVSFQYPYQTLQEPNANSFCTNANSQDFVDISLAASHVAHNTFSFQSSSRDGPNDPQANGSYNTVLSDSRTYGLPSQQSPFLHTQQGIQHPPTPPCYTGRIEHTAEHNGAISSSGALTPSGAIEQTPSTFQEKQTVFNPSEFSLHNNSVPALISKRQQPAKDFVHNQRILSPGNTLRRNIPQNSLNKVHFSSKPFNNVNPGSVPFDKSLSRIPQTWDTGSNGFPPLDQNSLPYPNASGNTLPYQCQPGDPRQALKHTRMSWQQGQLTSSTANQNQLELSRQNGNSKLPYGLSNADWQNNNLMPKILPSYHAKKHVVVEGSSAQRSEANRQSYSSTNDILYDSVKETTPQISDLRTKGTVYGMSQPIPQSRNNASQSAPLSGKTFVAESPCESPLPSPVTNPVTGSTCSSLSPMSSSPVNPSSEEGQIPPIVTSSSYFHPQCHQTDKSFHPNDQLNSGSFIYHNSEPTKSFTYISESSKDEQPFKNVENMYQKISNESNKGCIENFENEPPPPYASHHFLASSLSSANLDQLDVLLTCKQCDQNFGNLSSFLEHRQYCNLNSTLQNEMKDSLHSGEMRKSAADLLKSSQMSVHKGNTDFHTQLAGFNKDFLLDGETKGETKEDLLKGSSFHNVPPHLLPLTACDTLEMDDAKLDSLIIEALNGLDFQVDNPEIDSNFIDVFVDDDLTTSKANVCSQPHKAKEPLDTRKNMSIEEKHAQHNQVSNSYEQKCEIYGMENSYNNMNPNIIRNASKTTEVGTAHPYLIDCDTITVKQVTATRSEDCESQQKEDNKTFFVSQEKKNISLNKNNFEDLDSKGVKSYECKDGKNYSKNPSITNTPKPRRTTLRDVKKKKSHNGTWSKELIHKIVQQKNKLHKLHVKSNKNVQFSLVTERLFSPTKNHPFGEYDYISDSDEEVAANPLPSKFQPNGRLKYNFNRDLQGIGGRTKLKEPVWRMGEATRFQLQSNDVKNTSKDSATRVRRRSSQSSNSSDQSTSMSSETGSSPKSLERTDSENEQESAPRCKTFSDRNYNTALEINCIEPLYRGNSSEKQHSTDFSRGTKRFGSAKFLLTSSKVYPSTTNSDVQYREKDKVEKSADSTQNISKSSEAHCFKEGSDTRLSTYQEALTVSTLSPENYATNLILDINNVPQELSTFHADNTDYQKKKLDSSSSLTAMLNSDISQTCTDNVENVVKNVSEELCYAQKDFALPVPCFGEDSALSMLPQHNQKEFGNECQHFPENKHVPSLYDSHLFAKPQITAALEVEQMYTEQSNVNNINSFEQKCTDLSSYSSDKSSSTFPFHSSSIFAELPISGFESPMYNNVTPPKENYMDFNQPNKQTHFENQFPQYLQDKNWDLIEEGAAILSSNITPFSAIDNQADGKFVEQVPVPSEQMSVNLPRHISDYNASFINNESEDELEIKRLVTELENQLQTSKAHNDQMLAKHHINHELTDSPLTFPEMEVNQLENGTDNSFLDDNHNPLNDINILVPTKADCNIRDSQPLLKDNSSENLKSPWTCPIQLDTFTSNAECHKQPSMLASFSSSEDNNQFQTVNDKCLTEELASLGNNHSSPSVISDAFLPTLSNQVECQTFSDHELLRDTLVTTEILLSKAQDNNKIHEKETHQNDNESPTEIQHKVEEQFDDPPELEHFQSVAKTNSEFCTKDDCAPVLNMTVLTNENGSIPEPTLCNSIVQFIPLSVTSTEHSNEAMNLADQETLGKIDKRDDQITILDMPVLVKEESTIPAKSTTTQETTENPLQQLQLFVARTAKNNEEEMLLPCFPMILAASGTAENKSETERDASFILSSTETFIGESENLKMAETKGMTQFTVSGAQNQQCETVSIPEHKESTMRISSESIMDKVHCEKEQTNHFENECTSLDEINTEVGEMRTDCDNMLNDYRDTENMLQGQVKVNEEICHYGGNDGKKSPPFVIMIKNTNCSSPILKNEKFTSESISVPKTLSAQDTPSGRTDIRALLPGALNMDATHFSKEKADLIFTNNGSMLVCPEDSHQEMHILEETDLFLGNNETQQNPSILHKDNCDALDLSSHIPLQPITNESHHKSNNEYEAQLQDLGLPTEHSLLTFDLLSDVPTKEALTQQKRLYTSQKELHSPNKDPLCSSSSSSESTGLSDKLMVKNSVGATDFHMFLSEETLATSSLEGNEKLVTAEDTITITPVVEDGLSPCYCSELVCSHFKPRQVQTVGEIILGCQSLPTDNTYPPIYAGENNQTFSTFHNELFSEDVQGSVSPLMDNKKEEALKRDWNNTQDITSIDPVYPSEDNRSTGMVCDLMDIPAPDFVNFNCHQDTENADLRLVTDMSPSEAENNISSCESEKKGINDMNSVIDGVLRSLEGDKSREILQSIGITPKGSPVKEKKPPGPTLTCDICLVSFRSKPGLTRHKAVKHQDSITSAKHAPSDKILRTINKMEDWNCSNDSQLNLQSDAPSQNIITDLLKPSDSLHLVRKTTKTKLEKSANRLYEDLDNTDSSSKKKMNIKVKKRKLKLPSSKCSDSQMPPDDVLNILKTNILKAIGQSNGFSSTEEKTEWQDPSERNMPQKDINLEEVKLKMSASISIDDDEKLVSDVLDMEMNREEQTWTETLKEHVEQIINDCEDQPLKSMLTSKENLDGDEEHLKTAEKSCVQNDVHASNLPKETVTDLHTFFDDDNTFSQLFPRDEHFIRRKCTRVYGKRRRRQTPPFEMDFRSEDLNENCHASQMHYTCDYSNISGDTSSMDMRNTSGQTEHLTPYSTLNPQLGDVDIENNMLSFMHHGQIGSITEPSIKERNSQEKNRDASSHVNIYKPAEEHLDLPAEAGSDMRDSEVEENLDCKISNESGIPGFPTIDMKMLSAKFDMRELSFFSACGDDSDQSSSEVTDVTQKTEKRKRHAKNKNDEKRQLKNRNMKMKTKDKQYKCKVCFQWFLTLGELDFHKLTHNPSPPPTCYMCVQRKFSSREQLRDHLKDKHAKNKAGLWICGMCLKEISDVWMYNEHLREHATQFARKGQAQKSVMGIPGCFGEDSMVRTFLSTFIYRTPTKSSKNSEAEEKSPVAKRQDPKEQKDEEEVVCEKESENNIHVLSPTPKLVASSSSTSDSNQKCDTVNKNATMHPHCKDPSRDCHHCGKQFPKPFKLQRHLVVHSLQKIYLCHRCSKSYQEAQDLRSHLTNEHRLTEKSEIKHTTLYACELCADVMHVIKKSFICSTCNYTFSKKEQYDRHMEKHLIGGSMTFKFRGVTRPTMTGKEVKGKVKDSSVFESTPPSKKPRLSSYSDTTVNVLDSNDPPQCTKIMPVVGFDEVLEETQLNEQENAVKVEEMLLDATELLLEVNKEPTTSSSGTYPPNSPSCELGVGDKGEAVIIKEILPNLDTDTTVSSLCASRNVNFAKNNEENSKVKEALTKEQAKQKETAGVKEHTEIQTLQIKAADEMSHLQKPGQLLKINNVSSFPEDTDKESKCLFSEMTMEVKDDVQKALPLDRVPPVVPNQPKNKSAVTDTNALAKDAKSIKKNRSPNGKSPAQAHISASSGDHTAKSSLPKSKAACTQDRDGSTSTLKETIASQQKITKKEQTALPKTNKNTDYKTTDKMLAFTASRLHPKKCKDLRISGHKGNAWLQENFDGEIKKKKSKLAMAGKSESSTIVKKSEWANSLSDSKDEGTCNRVYTKPIAGGGSLQFKKTVLDIHNQKKVNAPSSNGEYRNKRALLTKGFHTFTPKSSPLPLNGNPHKHRLGTNTKPTEPSNYRTAESQNHLLNQLFGPKITTGSFKIPLRRDVTE